MEGYETPPMAGPGRIGQLAAIAVGTYTDIVDIIAPSEAASGDLVNIEVKVRNIWDSPFYISITGHYDGVDAYFSPDYALVEPGATYSFTYSFTMPDKGITFRVWCWYWTGTEWYQDDYDYVDIALKEVAPPVGCLPVVLIGLAIAAIAAIVVGMVS